MTKHNILTSTDKDFGPKFDTKEGHLALSKNSRRRITTKRDAGYNIRTDPVEARPTLSNYHSQTLVVGITHLLLPSGKPVRLLKCPICNFSNIYESEIDHHITFTDDIRHNVDVRQIDKITYVITGSNTSPYEPLGKAALNLPWRYCLFCDCREKVEFNLSLHMLEEHHQELLQIPITRQERKTAKIISGDFFARFERAIEYRLDKAVGMAKLRVTLEKQNPGRE
jgi:hypothetical protein